MNTDAIYDEKISPLMLQIIEICREHKIPLFAHFRLIDAEKKNLGCTSCVSQPDFHNADCEQITALWNIVKPESPKYAGIAVTKKGDGTVEAFITGSTGYTEEELEIMKQLAITGELEKLTPKEKGEKSEF